MILRTDRGDESIQRGHWTERLKQSLELESGDSQELFEGRDLVERYLAGEMRLHLHLGIRSGYLHGDLTYLCADLQKYRPALPESTPTVEIVQCIVMRFNRGAGCCAATPVREVTRVLTMDGDLIAEHEPTPT